MKALHPGSLDEGFLCYQGVSLYGNPSTFVLLIQLRYRYSYMSVNTTSTDEMAKISNDATLTTLEEGSSKPEGGIIGSAVSTFLVVVAAIIAIRVVFAGFILGLWNTRYIAESSALDGTGSSAMSYTAGFVATLFSGSASAIEVVVPTFWPLLFAVGFGFAAANPFVFTGRKARSSTGFIAATVTVLYLVQALFLTLRHWSELGII